MSGKYFVFVMLILFAFLCGCKPPGNNDTETPVPTQPPAAAQEKVVNITVKENCTRLALGTGSSIALENFLVDKKEADTFFLIEGTISGFGNYSGGMTQGWKYGEGDEVIAQGIMYGDTNNCKLYSTRAIISNHTTTGLQLLTFRYFTINGTTDNRPFNVYNPNNTEDPRLGQTCSVYVIWELRP